MNRIAVTWRTGIKWERTTGVIRRDPVKRVRIKPDSHGIFLCSLIAITTLLVIAWYRVTWPIHRVNERWLRSRFIGVHGDFWAKFSTVPLSSVSSPLLTALCFNQSDFIACNLITITIHCFWFQVNDDKLIKITISKWCTHSGYKKR